MFLKRLILVHWGNIPNTTFEFGPVNLFSGAVRPRRPMRFKR